MLACVLGCLLVAACGERPEPGAVADASASASGGVEIWHEGPRLPAPVSNNVVAAVRGRDGVAVLSFLGIDSTRSWRGITNAAYRWDFGSEGGWREIGPVPGPGRLGATAQAFAGRVFLFGGYTVAGDGTETTVGTVSVYNPGIDSWGFASDMPRPVDDAVSAVWAHSLIYLIAGWQDTANVSDVQVFDPSIDMWSRATPVPGPPVFGHAGGITGTDIVYVGGAKVVDGRPRFVADSTAWRGRIDPTDPSLITWEPIAPPPGPPLYRAAGGAVDRSVVLVGGTDNPYNYDGIGYDGRPSSPVHRLVAWDRRGGWTELPPPPVASMDHRSLAVAGGYVFLVGGMEEGQRVSDRVWYAEIDALLAGTRGR